MPLLSLQSAKGYGLGSYVPAVVDGSFFSIASTSFTVDTNSIVFDNIPTTYDHLQIRYTARNNTTTAGSNGDWTLVINNRTTADGSYGRMYSTGTAQSGSVGTGIASVVSGIGMVPDAGTTANTWGGGVIDLYNSSNTTQKRMFNFWMGTQPWIASTDSRVAHVSFLSQDTNAITKLEFKTYSSQVFTAGTTISLYGVKA